MPYEELEMILRGSLKPIEFQRKFARDFILSPIHVGVFLGLFLIKLTGLVSRDFSEILVWIGTLIYISVVATYFAFVYLIYPHTMRYCAVKRIPFVIHCYLVYLVFMILYVLVLRNLIGNYSNISIYKHFFNNVIFAIPFIALVSTVKGEDASIALFGDTNLYPPWERYKPSMHSTFQQISPAIVFPIRYIVAETPYVNIVTTKGTERLRMTFMDAINAVPSGSGWKVHRSIWIAKNEYADLKYFDGNPKVILKDGTVLNASRRFANFVNNNSAEVLHQSEVSLS